MTAVSGFNASDLVSKAFDRHPTISLKEFFVAMAIGEGKSRSKGKKEFERRKKAFQEGRPYLIAGWVKKAVTAINRDGPDAYLDYREPVRRRRRAEEADSIQSLAA